MFSYRVDAASAQEKYSKEEKSQDYITLRCVERSLGRERNHTLQMCLSHGHY